MRLSSIAASALCMLLACAAAQPANAQSSASSKAPANAAARCMQDMVVKRELRILKTLDAYYNKLSSALRVRRGQVTAAWGAPDKRKRTIALKVAWSQFGLLWRTAGKEMAEARKDIWMQYRLDILQCRSGAQDEEAGGYALDLQH